MIPDPTPNSPAEKLHKRVFEFAQKTGLDEKTFWDLLHTGFLRSDAEVTAFDAMEKGYTATCMYLPEYTIGVSTSG